MNIEKEREAFEQWVSGFGLNVSTEDGLYRSHVVGWMWHAWQARADQHKKELADAPQPDHIPGATKMVPVDKDCLTAEPTDSEMLDWLIEKEALICHSVTANLYEIWFDIDNVETGKTAREAITKAMRGEK